MNFDDTFKDVLAEPGTSIQGIDVGDWVKVALPSGEGFLPKKVKVLENVGHLAYKVINVRSVNFRKSLKMDARLSTRVAQGATVIAIDIKNYGGNWVQVFASEEQATSFANFQRRQYEQQQAKKAAELRRHLEILGLDGDALPTASQLKKAYFRKARATHPDKHGNTPEATKLFQDVNKAKEVVSQAIEDAEKEAAAKQQHGGAKQEEPTIPPTKGTPPTTEMSEDEAMTAIVVALVETRGSVAQEPTDTI